MTVRYVRNDSYWSQGPDGRGLLGALEEGSEDVWLCTWPQGGGLGNQDTARVILGRSKRKGGQLFQNFFSERPGLLHLFAHSFTEL
jgi:hypothetical protein